MSRKFAVLTVVATLLASGLARADQTATLPDGRSVLLKDNGTYQILPKQEPATAGGYQTMQMSDLKVDLKQLIGQKVRVSANGLYLGDQLVISDPSVEFDMNGVMVETKDLPRDVRKWIVTKCSEQCRVVVEGEVASGGFLGPAIVAHSVKGK